MIHLIDNEAITIEPAEAATFMLAWLEQHGARVTLGPEQQVCVDLDPLPNMTEAKAARLSQLVLSVRDELRELLIARTETSGARIH